MFGICSESWKYSSVKWPLSFIERITQEYGILTQYRWGWSRLRFYKRLQKATNNWISNSLTCKAKKVTELFRHLLCFGIRHPEVSESLQGIVEGMEPLHQSVSDYRDDVGRNKNCQHKEHQASSVWSSMNITTANRVNTTQLTTHTEPATQNRSDATAAKRVSTTTKGATRSLRTIILAASRKNCLVCPSIIIVPPKQ